MGLGPSTRDGKGGEGHGGKDGVGGYRERDGKEGRGEEISIHGLKLVAPPMTQQSLHSDFRFSDPVSDVDSEFLINVSASIGAATLSTAAPIL